MYAETGSDGKRRYTVAEIAGAFAASPPPPLRSRQRRPARQWRRFVQNLRRFLGDDLQYFAAVEPQRRLAPHVHTAMRGTVPRTHLRCVLAATYHQAWWPDTSAVRLDGDQLPVWDEQAATYLDPATGEVLPSWDDALDAIGPDDEPLHVARFGDRFGDRFDAQGVLAESKDAARCIGHLTKYDQAEAENIRVPAHPCRRPAILRDPELPLDRQARAQLLRCPRHAHRRPAPDARHYLITGGRDQGGHRA